MAVLSKHGTELLRVDLLWHKLSYRSDGNVLRNNGSGWKMFKKMKGDSRETFAAIAERAKRISQEEDEKNPFYQQFRGLLYSLVPFVNRYTVVSGLKAFSHDPDGLYIELNECYSEFKLSASDCISLCQSYNLMENYNK
jgi:hypothetical protein